MNDELERQIKQTAYWKDKHKALAFDAWKVNILCGMFFLLLGVVITFVFVVPACYP
jgi:hypothetical protein